MKISQQLFSFQGRINRARYWGWAIVLWVISGLLQGIAASSGGSTLGSGTAVATLLIAIILAWPGLALSIKRAHDRDRSGVFVLLFLVPILNLWPLVELYFFKGTTGSNRFGPDPLMGR